MATGDHMSIEEIKRRVRVGAARGLNRNANILLAEATEEAPLGPADSAPKGDGREGRSGGGGSGALRASGRGPITHDENAATAENLSAEVSFNTAYAAAQHEGIATHKSGFVWIVRKYTTPGTKKKFLSDPLKAGTPKMDQRIAEEIRKELQ